MKNIKISICISFAILFFSTEIVLAQSANRKKIKDQIVGIWQHVGTINHFNNNDIDEKKFIPFPPRILKIIMDDGTFTTVMITPKKFIVTGLGNYKITSDSTYIEQVKNHNNTTMIGKNNAMEVCFSSDDKTMANTFLLEQLSTGYEVNIKQTEYWERVEIENPTHHFQALEPNKKEKTEEPQTPVKGKSKNKK